MADLNMSTDYGYAVTVPVPGAFDASPASAPISAPAPAFTLLQYTLLLLYFYSILKLLCKVKTFPCRLYYPLFI
jgi:hypothetical protein